MPTETLPEPAATIILVREEAGELQVYLLRRSRSAVFMPGMHVFPGGRVDPADRDPGAWGFLGDADKAAVTRRLGADLLPEEAVAFGIAAVRETYEEAGVLLVTAGGNVEEPRTRLDRLRAAGDLPEGWLADHAIQLGWVPTLSVLTRWSRWITPAGMRRRYDTVFFVARMPEGQRCRPDGRETDEGLWLAPGEALARNLSGEVPLSPPIAVTLQEFLEHPDLEAVCAAAAARRDVGPWFPRLVPLERGAVIVEPWDPEFGQNEIRISPAKLEEAVLPAGAPFSRLWFNGVLWRPVAV